MKRDSPAQRPTPGHATLNFSGKLEQEVDATGTACDGETPEQMWLTLRSADVSGPTQPSKWLLSAILSDPRAEGFAQVQLHLGDWESGKQYVWQGKSAKDPGFVWNGEQVQLDVQLSSKAGETVRVRGTLTCPRLPSAPVPQEVLVLLRKASGREPLPYATHDFGRARHPGAAAVIVKEASARAIVQELRKQLPAGWLCYIGTTRFLGGPGPDPHEGEVEIVVAPGGDQFDILRTARSDAVNYDMLTEALIKQLEAWHRSHGIDIFHAETDTIEFRLLRLPEDVDAFAREVYAFCPDIVDQGVGSVEALARLIRDSREVYLWWD